MKLSDLRANDPVVKSLLQRMAEVNIQNPEYTAIKTILKEGADGRYASTEATFDDRLAMGKTLLDKEKSK